MQENKTIGILGLGSFGRFLAEMLARRTSSKIVSFDPHVTEAIQGVTAAASLPELVAQADILVLCVPLASYEAVLPHVKAHLKPHTLLVDICSVKIKPQELLAKHLPDHKNILCTHPLFGPQSTTNYLPTGHTLIITDSQGELAHAAEEFCKTELQLAVTHMSADEHDKTMAQVHALTFFVAHGLRQMHLPTPQFTTPSYGELLDLVELDKQHSPQLYDTIQNGNPYAKQMRQAFMATLQKLDTSGS